MKIKKWHKKPKSVSFYVACIIFCGLLNLANVYAKDIQIKNIGFNADLDARFAFDNNTQDQSRKVVTKVLKQTEPGISGSFDIFSVNKINDSTEISGNIRLMSGSNTIIDEEVGVNVDRIFVSINSKKRGIMEFGMIDNVTEKLRVDASTFAKGTGGIDGANFRLFTSPNAVYITLPRSLLSSGIANSSSLGSNSSVYYTQNKLGYGNNSESGFAYYSPRKNGFKFAFSFFKDTEDYTTRSNYSNFSNSSSLFTVTDVTSATINFYKKFSGVSLVTSASFDAASVDKKQNGSSVASSLLNRKNMKSSTFGVNIEYLGFVIGGSYANFGDSFAYYSSDNSQSFKNFGSSYYKDLGIGYSFGPFGISIGYLNSYFLGNKFQNLTLSSERNFVLNKDCNCKLKHYVEVSQYRFSDSKNYETGLKQTSGISGTLVTTGLRYKF